MAAGKESKYQLMNKKTKKYKQYRSAITGRFVSEKYAKKHPKTTYAVVRKK